MFTVHFSNSHRQRTSSIPNESEFGKTKNFPSHPSSQTYPGNRQLKKVLVTGQDSDRRPGNCVTFYYKPLQKRKMVTRRLVVVFLTVTHIELNGLFLEFQKAFLKIICLVQFMWRSHTPKRFYAQMDVLTASKLLRYYKVMQDQKKKKQRMKQSYKQKQELHKQDNMHN